MGVNVRVCGNGGACIGECERMRVCVGVIYPHGTSRMISLYTYMIVHVGLGVLVVFKVA